MDTAKQDQTGHIGLGNNRKFATTTRVTGLSCCCAKSDRQYWTLRQDGQQQEVSTKANNQTRLHPRRKPPSMMGPWYEAWWRNKQDVHLHLLVISTSAIYKIKKSLNKIIHGKIYSVTIWNFQVAMIIFELLTKTQVATNEKIQTFNNQNLIYYKFVFMYHTCIY